MNFCKLPPTSSSGTRRSLTLGENMEPGPGVSRPTAVKKIALHSFCVAWLSYLRIAGCIVCPCKGLASRICVEQEAVGQGEWDPVRPVCTLTPNLTWRCG